MPMIEKSHSGITWQVDLPQVTSLQEYATPAFPSGSSFIQLSEMSNPPDNARAKLSS